MAQALVHRARQQARGACSLSWAAPNAACLPPASRCAAAGTPEPYLAGKRPAGTQCGQGAAHAGSDLAQAGG